MSHVVSIHSSDCAVSERSCELIGDSSVEIESVRQINQTVFQSTPRREKYSDISSSILISSPPTTNDHTTTRTTTTSRPAQDILDGLLQSSSPGVQSLENDRRNTPQNYLRSTYQGKVKPISYEFLRSPTPAHSLAESSSLAKNHTPNPKKRRTRGSSTYGSGPERAPEGYNKDLETLNRRRKEKGAGSETLDVDIAGFPNDVSDILQQRLQDVGVKTHLGSSTVPSLSFTRQMSSKYDPDQKLNIPSAVWTRIEPNLIVAVEASTLAQLHVSSGIDEHCAKIQSMAMERSILYIVIGLADYISKRNARQCSAIAARVRKQNSARTRKASGNTEVSSKTFEELFLKLELDHGFALVHANNTNDFVDRVVDMTLEIASSTYKSEEFQSGELLSVGRVKAATDPTDFFSHALRSIKFVAEPTAEALVKEFGSIHGLVETLENNRHALSRFPITQGRTLNDTLAKTITEIFTTHDCSSEC